jgi:hypothetical protein
MPKKIKFSGKCLDVRAIMPVQPQNRLPGLVSWTSSKRITALSGFFMRARLYLSMVGWVGASQGAPGSLLDRLDQPHSAHHHRLVSKVVFHNQVGARS